MYTQEHDRLKEKMVEAVADKQKDPAKWMLTVRGLCEKAKLDPTRAINITAKSLHVLCFSVVDEAQKQGPRAVAALNKAIEELR